MASVFKRKNRKRWVIAYHDHEGTRHETVGAYDRAVTWEIARRLDQQVQLRRRGVIDPQQERLQQELAQPLSEHIEAFQAHLEAKADSQKHINTTAAYLREIAGQCGFGTLGDLDANRVAAYINALRRDGKGRVAVNARIGAVKGFSCWLWKHGKLRDHAMKLLSRQNARTDERHKRRVLTDEEVDRLLQATESGKPFTWREGRAKRAPKRRLTGPQRAMLYRLALETGLRQSECASLTPESFDLSDLAAATVTVEAAYSKRRRRDVQPLRRAFAEVMQRFLKAKPPRQRLFPLPSKPSTMFRRDLEAAGIDYVDAEGWYADFHSLRHTFITRLVRGGVAPAVAQRLARHSTITLTMDYYTHILVSDERAALDRLPALKGDTSGRNGSGGTTQTQSA